MDPKIGACEARGARCAVFKIMLILLVAVVWFLSWCLVRIGDRRPPVRVVRGITDFADFEDVRKTLRLQG